MDRPRRIAVLDAPSNLGLRPPTAHTVPGCAKAPGALRDRQLVKRLNAVDAGCLTPPRYDPSHWRPGDGVDQAAEIAQYTRSLADRVERIWRVRDFPMVLGGDCSVLLGPLLAQKRRASKDDSRRGLIFVDGNSDFRHPGNSEFVGAAAAEELALATGRGQPDLTDINGMRPYVENDAVTLLGIRPDDPYRIELEASGIPSRTAPQVRADGTRRSADWARNAIGNVTSYWLHVDVDVLDPSVMPAVDGPMNGGLTLGELGHLISALIADARCVGMDLTVFDPDYDPEGKYAKDIVDTLVAAFDQ
ncbi:arginase family protein [Salininema proteolyticum]|uniref:Arginase family protein n=1 Tax=Salininema proteolyticum TaxID=1607685 RepID=A0ABV8TWB5_9ACTN